MNIPLRIPEQHVLKAIHLDGGLGAAPNAETLRALAGLYDWGLVTITWTNDYGPVKYTFQLTPKGEELAQELFA